MTEYDNIDKLANLITSYGEWSSNHSLIMIKCYSKYDSDTYLKMHYRNIVKILKDARENGKIVFTKEEESAYNAIRSKYFPS